MDSAAQGDPQKEILGPSVPVVVPVTPVAGETVLPIYFATDRAQWEARSDDYWQLALVPLALIAFALLGPRLARLIFRPAPLRVRQLLRASLWVVALLVTMKAVGDARRMYQSRDRLKYGRDPARGLTVEHGVCHVSVPKEHVRGKIERPGSLDTEVHARDLMVRATQRFESASGFFALLRDRMRRSEPVVEPGKLPPLAVVDKAGRLQRRGQILVFIHGYNVTFDAAARRAAQVCHDIGFSGVTVMYSWPSGGSESDYGRDKDLTGRSAKRLYLFLRGLRATTRNRIHIVAHSMGNIVLSKALSTLHAWITVDSRILMTSTRWFDEIVLAAPDIRVDEFNEELGDKLLDLARRTTIYVSKHDAALQLSEWWAEHGRVGSDPGAIRSEADRLETIDATNVTMPTSALAEAAGIFTRLATGELQHSYFAENPVVLDDLGLVLQARPARLRPGLVWSSKGNYYEFPLPKETAD